ncbi:uncharacterized protein LOC125776214 [Bactrocera dorsalis]|uniref:Uncharacterized protein LOC125776214 n=1 Tax=Bactrocera dorsalis TaxID=27457 RepID=A0ABM3J241_BACDO|nr:uncharacterized protein LOC125776214 [Bactrocera dorsalis]
MLGNMVHLKNRLSHIWMLTGTGNHERFIDLTKIYELYGELLTKSLIGFHAFTGCDFNPAFFNKGKKRPFTLLKKNVEFQKGFESLGNAELTLDMLDNLFNVIQEFTCYMYNTKKTKDVDDSRFQLFVNSYKASDLNENFNKKVVNFDASSIPPCKAELYQQFLRAHYISSIWKNAAQKHPTMLNPLEYGWEQQDTSYVFKWFEGDQLPCLVSDFIQDIPDDNEDDEKNDQDDEHYDNSNASDDEIDES